MMVHENLAMAVFLPAIPDGRGAHREPGSWQGRPAGGFPAEAPAGPWGDVRARRAPGIILRSCGGAGFGVRQRPAPCPGPRGVDRILGLQGFAGAPFDSNPSTRNPVQCKCWNRGGCLVLMTSTLNCLAASSIRELIVRLINSKCWRPGSILLILLR